MNSRIDRIFVMDCTAVKPSIWERMVQAINPTGKMHSALVVDDVLYELDGRMKQAVLRWKFVSFEDAASHIQGRYGGEYLIEFYRLPAPVTDEQVDRVKAWWETKIRERMSYGWLAFALAALDLPWRWLQTQWFRLTGKVPESLLDHMQTRHYQCMSAVSSSLKSAGIDLVPDRSETLDYPGDYGYVHPEFKVFP